MQDKVLLKKNNEIEDFVNSLDIKNALSIDFEFMRRDTFYPTPCLIQISDGEKHACIDLLTNIDFKSILRSRFIECKKIIIHSYRQDLEILKMMFDYVPHNLFDTQLASSFLNYKYQISYAELVDEMFNTKIDKSSKLTNWEKRPLTDKQISYAINDVVYLNELYKNLKMKLEKENKILWYEDEMKYKINSFESTSDISEIWERIKGIYKLKDETRRVAKIISVWREQKAIKINVPRNWVLKGDQIIDIAKEYSNVESIDRNYIKSNYITDDDINYLNTFILENINNNIYVTDQKRSFYLTDMDKSFIKDIRAKFKEIAINNTIPPELFSSKKDIVQLVSEKSLDSRIINGWRKELIDKEFYNQIANYMAS
ncbi:MAG: hypothetical protein CMD90_02405 [Gammaproteobacteria bacterium]|nr:hypothetical protein [Gammaproteobacteria bacterium]